MADEMEFTKNEEEPIKGCAWDPEDGIVLEWWGRAEGLSDEQ